MRTLKCSDIDKFIADDNHCNRVSFLSYIIAQRMGLDYNTCKNVLLAGLYHDSGKAYLIESILNKPDKLTDEEMNHVKQHVLFSAAVAIKKGFNADVVRYIYHHHENYNGVDGYPSGLKGHNIPIGARIIRVADIYDALTNDRIYRKKYPRSEAIKIMNDNIQMLDTNVFNAFLSIGNFDYNFNYIKNIGAGF